VIGHVTIRFRFFIGHLLRPICLKFPEIFNGECDAMVDMILSQVKSSSL